ncbi:hypothetical protein HG536_0H02740 [Torulaspora globosa]|uniref:Tetrapyrrole methylase domain-containing protein n=1 Tax=Torulaspora globosa TaxID=48254 RepID=A0A7G3ZN13_9SACH|nr:uncharacterized protein HG536_0H02740 [Torulaspora globosa]QLL34899.1 hypothetical protein HG536_0H02740 [Torulaspora globosa]
MTVPLIIASGCENEIHLLIGTANVSICMKRIKAIHESGATPVVVQVSGESELKQLAQISHGTGLQVIDRDFRMSDLTSLGRPVVAKVVDRVFVNLPMTEYPLAREIYELCVKMRIPINTLQRPEYSTFHMISTYNDPKGSGLQIAVTTNGQGCILANRIKREIVASLPVNISEVVSNMGRIRSQIINEDQKELLEAHYEPTAELAVVENNWYGLNDDGWESHKLNGLVEEFHMTERQQKLRRTRWLSQLIEYYPLAKLADVDVDSLNTATAEGASAAETPAESTTTVSDMKDSLDRKGTELTTLIDNRTSDGREKKGSISLVGSGPGSVSMLTLGALNEIKTADLILADKLVPQSVLELVPGETEVFIARKFPGNAEKAQSELLERGLEGLLQGKKVVRLKQGDPYIFGRGGEEYLFFKQHGYEPQVLPGLSSALASTVVAKIPATQRDVADQTLICTGTGKKGALPAIPEFVSTRTTVFLMALHRAETLVQALLKQDWDEDLPAAIVERASCKDQRITRTLLKYVPQVVEEIGSRPPGLLVLGKAVAALLPQEDTEFSDTRKYYVEQGLAGTDIEISSLADIIT